MAFQQVIPPAGIVDGSDRALAFFVSDLHLANARPTNDVLASQPAWDRVARTLKAILAYLSPQGPLQGIAHGGLAFPEGQDAPSVDIVFVGDIFDFWKAIPTEQRSPGSSGHGLEHSDPLGWTTTGLTLWSKADFQRRFEQMLEYNRPILGILGQLVQNESRAIRLVFLTGNHDDPMEQEPSIQWQALLEAAIAGTTAGGMVPSGRVVVGNTYANKQLRVFAEHGHRYDPYNCYRDNGQTIIPSFGQHLVEAFLNGLHDFNLNPLGHRWERLVAGSGAAGALRKFMRTVDNYRLDADGQQALRELAERLGIQDATLLLALGAANAAVDAESFGNPGQFWGDLQFIFELLGAALFRKDGTADDNHLWTGARRLLGRPFNQLPNLLHIQWAAFESLLAIGAIPHSGPGTGVPVQVVVMGHTHLPMAEPPIGTPSGKPAYQYINTGTFVDMYSLRPGVPPNPPTPQQINSNVLLLLDLVEHQNKPRIRITTQGGGIDGQRFIDILSAPFPGP